MKELVEVIAKSLVTCPDQVFVTETVNGNNVVITLQVAPDDMGKVIGRQGRIAKAMRTLVKTKAAESKIKYNIEIADKTEE